MKTQKILKIILEILLYIMTAFFQDIMIPIEKCGFMMGFNIEVNEPSLSDSYREMSLETTQSIIRHPSMKLNQKGLRGRLTSCQERPYYDIVRTPDAILPFDQYWGGGSSWLILK